MLSENLSSNIVRPIFSNSLSVQLETIKLDAFIQSFTKGQTLPGKVVQALPEQKAVVEFAGQKVLLQFPKPVSIGQNITVQIEQIHPSPVLKLIDGSAVTPKQSQGTTSNLAGHAKTTPTDKTSLNSRGSDLASNERAAVRNPELLAQVRKGGPVSPKEGTPTDTKALDTFSKADLKRLGISVGQKFGVEVIQTTGRETLRVRLPAGEASVKSQTSQTYHPGSQVTVTAKPVAGGRFQLEVSDTSNSRPTVDVSVLKNYLATRQPLTQVLTGLKEVFLDGASAQLKSLNLEPAQLKQLQANLQKLMSSEVKNLDGPQVKEMLDRSGLHYEARVRDFVADPASAQKNALLETDLKGQLLRFARHLDQNPGALQEVAPDKTLGKLIAQVNQAVGNIELQQLTHHFSREAQQPLLLQIPDNLLGDEDRFKIYILPDQGEESGQAHDLQNRVFNLVFLLNLSALGDLRIETRVFKDDISILITGNSPEVIEFIQSHVPELEEPLRKDGFSLSVTSQYQQEVIMDVPDSLGQLLVDTPLQMVDIKT